MSQEFKDLQKNLVFHLSLNSKELYHSNLLNSIATKYPNLFNKVLKNLDVNFEISEEQMPKREHKNLDFCVLDKKGKIVFALENKFKSIPYKEQLDKYNGTIGNKDDQPVQRVLLTLSTNFPDREAIEQLNPKWKIVTYEGYIEALQSALKDENLNNELEKNQNKIEWEFDKQLYIRYCNWVSTIAEYINVKLNSPDKKWSDMFDSDLEEIRMNDIWQKVYVNHIVEQLKENIVEQLEKNSNCQNLPTNCQNLPTNDVGELVKHNNNKNNPYEDIYVESNFTKGAFFGIVIPHKVPDKNWFCVVIQIQNNYYRIGVVYEKKRYQNKKNDDYKNYIDYQVDALSNHYGRYKLNCFDGSFPYKYFDWAIDYKKRQIKDLLIENDNSPQIDTLIQRICSDMETISNKLKQ